ncbi:MAG: serpin family protein, partial [Gemmatimonadota bacterium]
MTTESRLLVRVVLLLLLLLAALAACQDPAGPGAVGSIDELPRPLTASEELVISGSNAFGLGLMSAVLEVDGRPNVVLSPLSASMALGMGLNGAAGTTLDGMRTALAYEGLSREEINDSYRGLLDLLADLDPTVELAIANSAWANREYSFRQPFLDALTEHFDAEVRSLDFADPATLTAINGWASDRTEGRIEKILDRLGREQALILLNAVWFDGRWTTRFDPDDTRQRAFTRDDGSTVTVPMMHVAGVEMPFGGNGDLVAVDLPYGGGAFSMTVAVPFGSEPARDILADMDDAAWDALIGSLQEREVDAIELP